MDRWLSFFTQPYVAFYFPRPKPNRPFGVRGSGTLAGREQWGGRHLLLDEHLCKRAANVQDGAVNVNFFRARIVDVTLDITRTLSPLGEGESNETSDLGITIGARQHFASCQSRAELVFPRLRSTDGLTLRS